MRNIYELHPRGEPPPESTRPRPNAKDDLRVKARELRLQGLDYDDIVATCRGLSARRKPEGAGIRNCKTAVQASNGNCSFSIRPDRFKWPWGRGGGEIWPSVWDSWPC